MSLVGGEDWSGLLKRETARVDLALAARVAGGRRVLVTGAGGSIGVELARALATAPHRGLILLDASEQACYELESEFRGLSGGGRVKVVLGNAGDPALLRRVFDGGSGHGPVPDLVIHAAAYKHVPLLEGDPFAAVSNNVLMTSRLLAAFASATYPGGCEAADGMQPDRRFVLVSTDKAADPANVMGATKRVAELLVQAALGGPVRAVAVRLGNVLGSQGSVVPLFRGQLREGLPLTVTSPGVRRFFMTPQEAVNALLEAAIGTCEGVVVADPGAPVLVEELARFLLRQAGVAREIVYTGLRAGDKMEEVLVGQGERLGASVAGCALREVISPVAAAGELVGLIEDLRQRVEDGDRLGLLEALGRFTSDAGAVALEDNAAFSGVVAGVRGDGR